MWVYIDIIHYNVVFKSNSCLGGLQSYLWEGEWLDANDSDKRIDFVRIDDVGDRV